MKRLIILALATTLTAAAGAQSWKNFYEAGIDAAKASKWADARADFLQASQAKHGDMSKASGGGLYSYHRPAYTPDFLAAYCGLKESLEMTGASRTGMLKQAAAEFEMQLNNKQYSAEAFFFLDETYVLLGETVKREELGQEYNTIGALNWKVDTKGIADDDQALVSQLPPPAKVYGAPTPAPTKKSQPTQKAHTAPTPAISEAPVASTDPDVKPVVKKNSKRITSLPKASAKAQTTKIPAAPIASTDPDVKPLVKLNAQPASQMPKASSTKPAEALTTAKIPAAPIATTEPEVKPVFATVKSPATPTPQPLNLWTAPAKATPSTTVTVNAPKSSAVQAPVTAPQTPATSASTIPTPAVAVPAVTSPTATVATTQDTTQTPATVTSAPTPAEQTPSKKQKKHRKDRDKKDEATASTPITTSGLVVPVAPKEIAKGKSAPTANSVLGAVPTMGDKYALIIGNSESKTPDGALPYAADDAQLMRQSLITDGGYLDQNIEVVINATAAQIAATVNALSSRVPDKGTVFIYFTGVGTNIDGKDYLAGVDTDTTSDSSTMISKDDIYRSFMLKGARIFAFYQANRPIVDGHFFGSETPLVGSISQMQATLPGENIYSINADGKQVGLFTNGFVATMKDIRSNRTPILDFGWALFYKMRRGDTGSAGGSSNQSPSLPVPTNMASDARF